MAPKTTAHAPEVIRFAYQAIETQAINAKIVKSRVAEVPKENAAPGFRAKDSFKNEPNIGIDFPDSKKVTAKTFES